MYSDEKGKVAIILLNYNGAGDTIECIESIKQSVYKNYEIIVVDNCSTDDSVSVLEDYSKKTPLIFLRSKWNNGFSAGNNIGIREAQKRNFDYVLLLNNDTLVTIDFLQELLNAYERVDKGSVLSGTIMYAYEREKIWYAGGSYSEWTAKAKHLRMNETADATPTEIEEVNFISGCEVLIPIGDIKKIGLMDEDYFLYTEDLDYSIKIKKARIKMYYVPKSVIYHKVSSSTQKISKMVSYYSVRNRRILIHKHFPFPKRIIAILYTDMQSVHRIVRKRLYFKPAFLGVVDYYKHRFGKSNRVL